MENFNPTCIPLISQNICQNLSAAQCRRYLNTCTALRNCYYLWKSHVQGRIQLSPRNTIKFVSQWNLEIKQCYQRHKFECSTILKTACILGQLDILACLGDETAFQQNLIDTAAKFGHFELVVWLHDHQGTCTTEAMDNAAANGHVKILKFLHENRFEGCTTRAMDGAARNGRIGILKWLSVHTGEGFTQQAINDAENHPKILNWLEDHIFLKKRNRLSDLVCREIRK